MPKKISPHVAIRTDFRVAAGTVHQLNQKLESVVAVKSRGSSESFHGKIDHSQPPWNAGAANMVLDLHAWARATERAWMASAGFPERPRGGSGDNTRKALEALTRLSERVDDDTVNIARSWLNSWCWRAKITLGEEEAVKRLPRRPGEKEPDCPWCKKKTLRQKALEGAVFCIDPECTDDEDRRPMAILEYFRGDMVLRWQDGIIGEP